MENHVRTVFDYWRRDLGINQCNTGIFQKLFYSRNSLASNSRHSLKFIFKVQNSSNIILQTTQWESPLPIRWRSLAGAKPNAGHCIGWRTNGCVSASGLWCKACSSSTFFVNILQWVPWHNNSPLLPKILPFMMVVHEVIHDINNSFQS